MESYKPRVNHPPTRVIRQRHCADCALATLAAYRGWTQRRYDRYISRVRTDGIKTVGLTPAQLARFGVLLLYPYGFTTIGTLPKDWRGIVIVQGLGPGHTLLVNGPVVMDPRDGSVRPRSLSAWSNWIVRAVVAMVVAS